MQNKGRFVAYYRVSTEKQGVKGEGDDTPGKKARGLGIEAQKEAVRRHIGDNILLAQFTEVESGRKNDRPALAKALAACRLHNATLVVAKLDRLSRDAGFLKKMVSESGERGVAFCDMPTIPEGPTGKFIIGMLAEVAELEAGMISVRTKAALAVLKQQGVKLGTRDTQRIIPFASEGGLASSRLRRERARQRALDLMPLIEEIRGRGVRTLSGIAEELNAKGITAPRGGRWASTQVGYVLDHVAAPVAEEVAA